MEEIILTLSTSVLSSIKWGQWYYVSLRTNGDIKCINEIKDLNTVPVKQAMLAIIILYYNCFHNIMCLLIITIFTSVKLDLWSKPKITLRLSLSTADDNTNII